MVPIVAEHQPLGRIGICEMNDVNAELTMLRLRMAGIGAQLDGRWSKTLDEQRHLDIDTNESAYWHSGYHQALSDVINMMSKQGTTDDTSDTSNPFQTADLDARSFQSA
jgi:hypothetical protein